ncbi:MAG: DUF523 domain-containing protein [Syntrophomonadaceae bacterium]|nr:DUF523 domain-containing protein [Syntrophomonadaceae bacterium]MDD3897863.1 DUF523 domain-containing protein [Syntrophomonadaceae bacterium]
MKLVSACLCGINCKYNGKNNLNLYFMELLQEGDVIPVCPEQLGGLPTPRLPAEIDAGSGQDVLVGYSKVLNKNGEDVSDNYIKGAYETLKIAQLAGVDTAILKSRSPSCGSKYIYDGSFSYKLRQADGVTAALLKENGIRVMDEDEYMEKGECQD